MKYFLILIILLFILLLVYIWRNKIRIKWKTFLKRGFAPKRGQFGLYVYDGKQGKGKTYPLVEYLIDNKDNIEIFCNIKDIKNIRYRFFTGFSELIEIKKLLDSNQLDYDKSKQLVIVYDEIFTELQKHSKLNKEVIDFLCQMRKRKIIFLTTAQEWAEIPLTFRRFCRYEIKCNMINFLGLGILIKTFGDAENMKWSDEDQEHICPLIETTVTHCRKYIANSYDTFLRISSTAAPQAPAGEEEKVVKVLNYDKDFWNDSDDNFKPEDFEETND